MKTTITVLLLLLSFGLSSQTIQQMGISPANPTAADLITVYADLQFAYTDCQMNQQFHSASGNTITGAAFHCMGIAAAICYVTDSFHLGRLSPGNYDFIFNLSHHGGFGPCIPTFAISDVDTLNFTVQGAVGLKEQAESDFKIYPNPTTDFIQLSIAENQSIQNLIIRSSLGQVVLESTATNQPIDVSELPTGLYILEINQSSGRLLRKFLKQ